MSDSLRPTTLVCPDCGHALELELPRVESLIYVCDRCKTRVQQSLITGTATVLEKTPTTFL